MERLACLEVLPRNTPPREIAVAIQRKQQFDRTPKLSTTRSNRGVELRYGSKTEIQIGHTAMDLRPVHEEEILHAEIARKIYDLRTKSGLSQRELAKKVGTSASTICRLEDAGYDGHSLFMLQRIAEALDKRVEIRFVSTKHLQPA